MNPRRQKRKVSHFIQDMIKGGNIEIKCNTSTTKLSHGFSGQVVSYDISAKDGNILAQAPKWFGGQDVAVVSLTQTEGLFFPDFSLEINHVPFDMPERTARVLYNQVESARVQLSKPVKSK